MPVSAQVQACGLGMPGSFQSLTLSSESAAARSFLFGLNATECRDQTGHRSHAAREPGFRHQWSQWMNSRLSARGAGRNDVPIV
jgi:hypothetical protein